MRELTGPRRYAADMLAACETVSFATVNEDGYPRVCIVSPVKVEGYATVFFSTSASSEKVRQLMENPKSSVCYQLGGDSQTLVGTARVLTDLAVKKDLWRDWMLRHFPLGPQDPDYCIVRFDGEKATLWYEGNFVTFDVAEG